MKHKGGGGGVMMNSLGGMLSVNLPFSDGNSWKIGRERPGLEEKGKKEEGRENILLRDPKLHKV